jgi:hypothetical protein
MRHNRSVNMARAKSCSNASARIGKPATPGCAPLAHVELLVIDDIAFKTPDKIETTDFCELVVEQHQKASILITSNREPGSGWPWWPSLLAQSGVNRFASTCHDLSTRASPKGKPTPHRRERRRNRDQSAPVVPSPW